ncbi:MAG: ABC transporter ATP-binding protein [Lachnospiraceae bacterium]|jgi:ABC-type multidrug transport system fused ATPase/permease subunit|nr:ABC transporter ATP-binding protein [Lachnospiraceae bacterium]
MAAAEKRYRGIYILTVILGFIAAIFMARFSFCLGKVIDVVIDPTDSLQTTILSCIYMAVCWLIVSFLYNYTEIIYVNKIVHSLKTNLYKALYQKELKTFLAEKNGHYLSLYSKDIDLVVDNYLMPKCDIVSNILSAVVCLLSIFVINWKLGLSFVMISFITVMLSQIPGTIMARKTVEYTHSNSIYMTLLENYLKGFEQVKLLGLGKLFREKLNAKDCAYEKSRMHYLFAKIVSNNIGMAIGMLSQLLCMAVGIWFVLHEDMTVGLLIAAVQLLNGVFSPLQLFVQEKNLMGTTKEIIRRIDQEQIIEENLEKEIIGQVQKIEFQDVNLQFGDKEIFQGFHMLFEAGKKYAIIGESGKGKSTLMHLLMKYLTDSEYEGSVMINQQDIRTLDSDSIYQKIGYIQRNEFLIDGSVKDNIILYRDGVSDGEVNQICRDLKFDSAFVQKEIDASDSGEVSFGEKQRIDIARFMVHDYDVLVFDEPTSNLDADTANEIFHMIFGIRDKIVIVITHDTSKEVLDRFDVVLQL